MSLAESKEIRRIRFTKMIKIILSGLRNSLVIGAKRIRSKFKKKEKKKIKILLIKLKSYLKREF